MLDKELAHIQLVSLREALWCNRNTRGFVNSSAAFTQHDLQQGEKHTSRGHTREVRAGTEAGTQAEAVGRAAYSLAPHGLVSLLFIQLRSTCPTGVKMNQKGILG